MWRLKWNKLECSGLKWNLNLEFLSFFLGVCMLILLRRTLGKIPKTLQYILEDCSCYQHKRKSIELFITYNVKLLQVETVEGLKDLRIPAGVQPGDKVSLSRMGVPNINKPSVRGDHLFIVNVQIPTSIRFSVLPFLSC